MPISTIGTNSLGSTAQIGSLTTASGSAPSYSARAWVNFNGTGTVAIRASGNVSSITDNGTGDYTVNFTTAMQDADYAIMGSTIGSGAGLEFLDARGVSNTTTTARFGVAKSSTSSLVDDTNITLAVFR